MTGHPTPDDEVPRLRRRLRLMYDAAQRIGSDLDTRRTAEDIVDVLVPDVGELAVIDLGVTVPTGDDPEGVGPRLEGTALRFAVRGTRPERLYGAGDVVPAISMGERDAVLFGGGVVVVEYPWRHLVARVGTEQAERIVPGPDHRALVAPVFARGQVLGAVTVWQRRTAPVSEDDVEVLREIATRGGLAIDNARRYIREHATAVQLQRLLLPSSTSDTDAAETAAVYRPASQEAGVGGDWFDVIALSSARVGLVVGDVFGRGLAATATMGRVRAAMLTLADLDLDPDELLIHVDDLVQRLAGEGGPGADTIGATCVYAVHDPVTSRCVVASAGHPPPLLMLPGREPVPVGVEPGPPLGVGGVPYAIAEVNVEPGAVLAFHSNGLVEDATGDTTEGMRRLCDSLRRRCAPGRPLREVCEEVVADTATAGARDDITLLLARTRAVASDHTARWRFPARPEAVADVRHVVGGKLAEWHLDDAAFTAELVVSELATNAVRYAGGDLTVRLIRGTDRLICEVGDSSSSQPRIRRAKTTDEGGRGLYLVAQMADRWGCRYGHAGKTIWAEQRLAPGEEEPQP